MNQRPIYIEHPDLTKMLDKQLEKEERYLFDYAEKICKQIINQFRFIEKDDLPTWKIVEDLRFVTERYFAIREEIEYRKQMMR